MSGGVCIYCEREADDLLALDGFEGMVCEGCVFAALEDEDDVPFDFFAEEEGDPRG